MKSEKCLGNENLKDGWKRKNSHLFLAPFTTNSVVCDTTPAALLAVQLNRPAWVASTDSIVNTLLLRSMLLTRTPGIDLADRLLIVQSIRTG